MFDHDHLPLLIELIMVLSAWVGVTVWGLVLSEWGKGDQLGSRDTNR